MTLLTAEEMRQIELRCSPFLEGKFVMISGPFPSECKHIQWFAALHEKQETGPRPKWYKRKAGERMPVRNIIRALLFNIGYCAQDPQQFDGIINVLGKQFGKDDINIFVRDIDPFYEVSWALAKKDIA